MIEDQRKRQVKAVQDQRHVKTIKKYDYVDISSKQKKKFNELERKGFMKQLS